MPTGARLVDQPLFARDSERFAREQSAWIPEKKDVDEPHLAMVRPLGGIAAERGQSLAQMALAWVLRDQRITSALIGASRVEQIEQNVAALANLAFSEDELARIDAVLKHKA